MTVLLRRVYSLVGGREIQVNNGDTTQDEISPPGVCGGGLGEGVGNSSSEKVTLEICQSLKMLGERKRREMVGKCVLGLFD